MIYVNKSLAIRLFALGSRDAVPHLVFIFNGIVPFLFKILPPMALAVMFLPQGVAIIVFLLSTICGFMNLAIIIKW